MRSQARFRLLVIAAIVAFSLVLSACGAPARAPAAMDAAVSSDSAPAVAYEMAEAVAEMPAGAPLDRKIIGTASIDLVVADTNTAIPAVTQLAAAAGGYVADASVFPTAIGVNPQVTIMAMGKLIIMSKRTLRMYERSRFSLLLRA